MWIFTDEPPRPDASFWPGRRALAAIDALAWPALWMVAVTLAPFSTGIVGPCVMTLAIAAAVRRVYRAIWRNERYWFTTWRWGVPIAKLIALGLVFRLVLLHFFQA